MAMLTLGSVLLLTGCAKEETKVPGLEGEDIPVQTEASSQMPDGNSEELVTESPTEDAKESSESSSTELGNHQGDSTQEETSEDENTQEPIAIQGMLELPAAAEKTDILNAIQQAIEGMHSGFSMDVTAVSFDQDAAIEVKNLYFQVMSAHPKFRYAFDITSEITNGKLVSTLSYMPYKTGEFPEGFEGQKVAALEELLAVAESNLDKDSVAIQITNPSLGIGEMEQTLRQAGDGYFVCMLNSDATAIKISCDFSPYTKEESLQQLAEIQTMADEVIAEHITEGMTDEEKARALYTYITDTVVYDQRYYSDRENMPFVSMTAYGAFHDGMAICGGYGIAIRTLFNKVGIPCYLVSGEWGREGHLWNVAKIGDEWLYFDATADRGRNGDFRSFAVTAQELTSHTWDMEQIEQLLK